MLKRNDYIIISIICLFMGAFVLLQYRSSKLYNKVIQPENNAVLAVEVAKMTTANSDLRQEVAQLTSKLDIYKSSSDSSQQIYEAYQSDSKKLDIINGISGTSGQGVTIHISGNLSLPQSVDLVNAVKNIGSSLIAVNSQRILINTNFSPLANQGNYEIKVLGNSRLLKTALERKGGIIETISTKDMKISVETNDRLDIPSGTPINLIFSKIITS